MYTSRPTAQGDSPHGALFNKYPSGQTIINIMNCDLLNSFKVLQIICQVIACFFINKKTTPTTPAISQNRHYPADKIYHHSNTNHRLCQIAFLKLFNLCCHSAGFVFEFWKYQISWRFFGGWAIKRERSAYRESQPDHSANYPRKALWLICTGHGAMGQWQCVMVALTGFEPATKRLWVLLPLS